MGMKTLFLKMEKRTSMLLQNVVRGIGGTFQQPYARRV